ncbi:kinase-like domain-containing protein [Rhizophagus irregularis DAOM 181602=DAOM 197198]|nr:kinase-like domain-containing protein [Rhizophagus irregularis DAOM 181602=DAOM 197198]
MSIIRKELAHAAISRSLALIDYNVHKNIHKIYEFQQQTLLADNSFTKDEKNYAINWITRDYDRNKINNNSGTRRICENSDWVDGKYEEWDSKKQQLKRVGRHNVILKKLENVESANQSWFEEAKSHLTISNKRPKIVSGTPTEYKNLMEQCWDADPSKRPDTNTLMIKIREMNFYYQSMTDESEIHNNLELDETNSNTNSRLFTSKIHQFENLPEPRNATEEELDVFHSKPYDYSIPTNIDNSSNQNNSRTSKINSFFKANSKKLSKMFKKLQVKDETVQQTKGPNVNFNDDEDEVYNNPNFHSKEQDEFEIPNDTK